MIFGPWKRTGLSALLAAALGAQQPTPPAAPRFEVVSIRPVPPNAPLLTRDQDFTPVLPGGQYIDSRTVLLFMVTFAYDVKNPSTQLVGLPKWAQNQPIVSICNCIQKRARSECLYLRLQKVVSR